MTTTSDTNTKIYAHRKEGGERDWLHNHTLLGFRSLPHFLSSTRTTNNSFSNTEWVMKQERVFLMSCSPSYFRFLPGVSSSFPWCLLHSSYIFDPSNYETGITRSHFCFLPVFLASCSSCHKSDSHIQTTHKIFLSPSPLMIRHSLCPINSCSHVGKSECKSWRSQYVPLIVDHVNRWNRHLMPDSHFSFFFEHESHA